MLALASHKVDQMMENYEFLRENGCSVEVAARRLGVNVQALQRAYERRGIPLP